MKNKTKNQEGDISLPNVPDDSSRQGSQTQNLQNAQSGAVETTPSDQRVGIESIGSLGLFNSFLGSHCFAPFREQDVPDAAELLKMIPSMYDKKIALRLEISEYKNQDTNH